MLRKIAGLGFVLVMLASCATTNTLPEGYTGPIAHIKDTIGSHGGQAVDFFVLSKIDGRQIYDSIAATTRANEGRGFAMEPIVLSHDVAAQPATFEIKGRTHYAAPIQELSNKVYQVIGTVRFTPEPDHTYLVKGTLGDDYSAVWIEDSATGNTMDKKIEIHGRATLGIMEK